MAVAPTAPKPHPKAKRLSGAASYLVWGSLAVCAVVAASVLIALGIGASRGGFGVAQTTTVRPPPTVVQKPQAASEFEVARLNDALRALGAERSDRSEELMLTVQIRAKVDITFDQLLQLARAAVVLLMLLS